MAGGLVAYLLGSVPFGFLLSKTKGIDVRTRGSGNIGATNVFRSVSKPLGLLTFVCDFLKGYAGAAWVPLAAERLFPGGAGTEWLPLACGACTIFGHNWTCFLGFKGGKGIASSAGMLLALTPVGVAIALGTWLAVFLSSRYVSLASIAAAVALGIAVWPLYFHTDTAYGIGFPAVLTALALIAIAKHHANIGRLLAGTESRFNFGKRK